MPSPTLDHLLAQALDAAYASSDAHQRVDRVEAVAAAAIRHGRIALAEEILLDLDDPIGCAWLRAQLADYSLARREWDDAGQHLAAAQMALQAKARWRPREDWVGPGGARARLAVRYARLGQNYAAEQLLEHPTVGRSPRAAGLAAIAGALLAVRDAGAHRSWQAACAAALSLGDPEDIRRALVDLAAAAIGAEAPGPATQLVRDPAVAEALPDPLQRALLAEAIARLLVSRDHPAEARAAWQDAIDLALTQVDDLMAATDLACRVVRRQLDADQIDSAVDVLSRVVARVATGPLSPSPSDRFPWRALYQTSRRHPQLACPLRDNLRHRRVVPPAWCYGLGLLEQLTGFPERARAAADALEQSHSINPSDLESLWLAALLRCKIGDVEFAADVMREVLDAQPSDHPVAMPGEPGGGVRLELAFVEALLDMGAVQSAIDLARTVGDGRLRADLLRQIASIRLIQGPLQEARDLAFEAAEALEEANHRAPLRNAPIAGEIARLLWACGEEFQATGLLQDTLSEFHTVPPVVAMPSLCNMAGRFYNTRAAGLLAEVDAACTNCITRAPDSETRVTLILQWIAARHPPAR